MIEYHKNKSIKNLFYIDENGVVQEEFWGEIPNQSNPCLISCLGRTKSIRFVKVRKINSVPIKKEKIRAVKPDKDGYLILTVRINKKAVDIKIHQMMAIVFLNHVPNGIIDIVDHKNNNNQDNRLENLQIIPHRKNSSKDKSPKSGFTGVSISKKRYKACIGYKNKSIHIGTFDTLKEASEKYKEAEELLEKGMDISHLKVKHITKTGVVGVCKNGRNFRALIYKNKKQICIGTFPTIEEAKKAYDDYLLATKNPK